MTDPDYSPRYVRFAVGMLVAAVGVEFFHRQLLAIALEPIRLELGFSDTEMGMPPPGVAPASAGWGPRLGRRGGRSDRRAPS
ncbi:MAG: hypothetical protein ABFS46_10965, partial [Myxococcota bacterium]